MERFDLVAEARRHTGRSDDRERDRPIQVPATRVRGKVKWFNGEGMGYGFIQPDRGGKDIFVHANAVRNSGLADLFQDQKVEYEVAQGKKGLEAVNLTLVG